MSKRELQEAFQVRMMLKHADCARERVAAGRAEGAGRAAKLAASWLLREIRGEQR